MSDPPLPVKTEHLPPLGTLMPSVRRVHFLRKLCCSLTLQGGSRPYHFSDECWHQCLESLVACVHAVLHARTSRRVAGFLGFVQDGDRSPGDAARLDEYGRVQGFARVPSVVELLGGDETFERNDLTEHSAHSHL